MTDVNVYDYTLLIPSSELEGNPTNAPTGSTMSANQHSAGSVASFSPTVYSSSWGGYSSAGLANNTNQPIVLLHSPYPSLVLSAVASRSTSSQYPNTYAKASIDVGQGNGSYAEIGLDVNTPGTPVTHTLGILLVPANGAASETGYWSTMAYPAYK